MHMGANFGVTCYVGAQFAIWGAGFRNLGHVLFMRVLATSLFCFAYWVAGLPQLAPLALSLSLCFPSGSLLNAGRSVVARARRPGEGNPTCNELTSNIAMTHIDHACMGAQGSALRLTHSIPRSLNHAVSGQYCEATGHRLDQHRDHPHYAPESRDRHPCFKSLSCRSVAIWCFLRPLLIPRLAHIEDQGWDYRLL